MGFENTRIFEKLANFELNPQEVTVPVTNLVLKRMPYEIGQALFDFANTHLRLCQYADYNPDDNPNPQLSFWNSVYYAQLGQIEDYECEECEDTDDPTEAISDALLLGAGVVVGAVLGVSNAAGLLLSQNAGGLLLPAATPYIDVVGTAIKGFTSSPPVFILETPVASFPYFPVSETVWNDNLDFGDGLAYRVRYHVLTPLTTKVRSIATNNSLGHTAYARLTNGSDILPIDAGEIDVG